MSALVEVPPLKPVFMYNRETCGSYPVIRENYFKNQPEAFDLFKSLIHLVPVVVNRIGCLLKKSRTGEGAMNGLYHKGLRELVFICQALVIEGAEVLEIYAKERLSANLLAEVDLLLN